MTDHDDTITRQALDHLEQLGTTLLSNIDETTEPATEELLHAQLHAAQAYARTLRDELDQVRVRQQPAPSEWLRSDTWNELRDLALDRFNNRCAICNTDQHVDVHHRTYERYGGDERLDDLTALCRGCHELFSRLGRLAGGTWVAQTKERFLS